MDLWLRRPVYSSFGSKVLAEKSDATISTPSVEAVVAGTAVAPGTTGAARTVGGAGTAVATETAGEGGRPAGASSAPSTVVMQQSSSCIINSEATFTIANCGYTKSDDKFNNKSRSDSNSSINNSSGSSIQRVVDYQQQQQQVVLSSSPEFQRFKSRISELVDGWSNAERAVDRIRCRLECIRKSFNETNKIERIFIEKLNDFERKIKESEALLDKSIKITSCYNATTSTIKQETDMMKQKFNESLRREENAVELFIRLNKEVYNLNKLVAADNDDGAHTMLNDV